MSLRFTGSDRAFIQDPEVQVLASEVAAEIGGGQYDGYRCKYKPLSDAIAGGLATLTIVFKWRIYADFDEQEQMYRVWVER